MPRKRPRVVPLDEVRITRRGETAEFEYADEAMGGMSLELGVDVTAMTDQDLLDRHNEAVRAMEAAARHEHVAVEIPVGRPQLRYSRVADQWCPRGSVVRCVVHDGPDGQAVIEVDDHELSLPELGRMLTTFAGWGMRIVFVPEEEIDREPRIEVREPTDEAAVESPAPVVPVSTRASGTSSDPVVRRMLERMPIYRLRITLAGTEPPVWRSVMVSGNVTLKGLHRVIQMAMGWTNSHLHLFVSADRKTLLSDPRAGLDHAKDEGKVKLRSFAPRVGDRFSYEYDLGDSWKHEVVVEDIVVPQESGRWPRCVDGARACPPEDCGGVGGYQDLVEAMGNPRHPDRERLLAWLGSELEPEAFDIEATNRRLSSIK
jgi:hypothetical protein